TIPANGFVLAATISRPAAVPTARKAKLPAVVLVSGSEPTDRDATVSNVPIFAQIAGALADAGFLVVRYDKRGVGQSGGRVEAATIADYADDAVAVTRYLEKRKDVDRRRIAVVGYGEGGWIALVAGSRNSGIAALTLVATAGTTGAELMLERQRHALERLQIPDAEKLARVEFQQKLQQAVLTGAGWEAVPPELRRQADTPWFRSFLAFDPARIMTKVRRPILILQGALDRQVSMSQFEKLTAAAKARKPRQGQTVEPRTIDGINHLLVPAGTGEIDEYATLTDQNVARELLETLGTWLKATLGGVDRK
ncbi:MAG: alpha/beta fold hydrolase, partial [Planctomycetes bacterium]|nr:alpha/beta fold hydrolase [Planctomycetota bacterium]